MRALVTGATGFIGSYLTELLVRQGEPVAVLCRPGSNTWRIREVLPQVTQISGDLLDLPAVASQIRDFAPDTVFHLAWYGVGNSYRNDEDQVDKNLYSSLALARLARDLGCATWLGIGSQAEYGPQNRAIDETAPANPTTLYGTAKLCVYLLLRQLLAGSRTRLVWMRLFSSYGPKDNPEWMIPYLIQSLLRGEKPALTAGEQKWDYLYVSDVARALYLAGVTTAAAGVFNVGSGRAETLRSIIERIRDYIDPELPLGFGQVPYRPDQVMHLQADTSRLQEQTGWQPQVGLADGLRQTIAWFEGAKIQARD